MSGAPQCDSSRKAAAWLLVLYVAVYILPLGMRPLSSPDEVRYGAISHEMLASGDWVSPHFNGARYFEKPIMGYWLNSLSMRTLGENPFALRLPTVLAAGLTALTIWLLTAHIAGRRTASVAAAIFLTTLIVVGVGTTAVFDTFLTLFLTAALATYFVAMRAPPGRGRNAWLAACGVACGAAFLTKGFLALAIPVIVATPFLVLERRWRDLLTSAWIPMIVAAIVVAPWGALIHVREPDFWRYFFWVEHIQRFVSTDNAQHSQPFWYYFATAPFAGFPWIWMLPAAAQGLRRSPPERTFLVYLACWFALPWLFFSVSHGKLLTYVLPCFAPLSILLAMGLERYWQQASQRYWRIGAICIAAMMVLSLTALVAAQSGALGAPVFQSFESARLALFSLCLLTGLGAAIAAIVVRRPIARLVAFCVPGAALIIAIDLALPQETRDDKAPQVLLSDGVLSAPDAIVVTDSKTFGAVSWYTKRNDLYVLSPGELAYGLEYPDSRRRNLEGGGLAGLLRENRGRRDVFIVVRPEQEAAIDAPLPKDAMRLERSGLVRWHIPATARHAPGG